MRGRRFCNADYVIECMVRPDRFELPTFWFVARRSIQLSYGRDSIQYNKLHDFTSD